jgi:hypothetical protein
MHRIRFSGNKEKEEPMEERCFGCEKPLPPIGGRFGWEFDEEDGWLCPECVDNLVEQAEEWEAEEGPF